MHWMVLECQGHRQGSSGLSPGNGVTDECLVAKMYSVKDTDGHYNRYFYFQRRPSRPKTLRGFSLFSLSTAPMAQTLPSSFKTLTVPCTLPMAGTDTPWHRI